MTDKEQLERVAMAIKAAPPEDISPYGKAQAAIDAMQGWRPIENAPRDREILLYCKETGEQFVGQWMKCLEDDHEMFVTARVRTNDGESITIGCRPDYWQETPEPPKEPHHDE